MPPLTTNRDRADAEWMRRALAEAEAAFAAGEVPVGALVVRGDELVSWARNEVEENGEPTAHAELLAIQEASRALGDRWLSGCTLVVTLEPCAMCAGAIVLSRLDRVVFGAWDEKAGMGGSVEDLLRHPRLNHRPEVRGGVLAEDCGALLSRFFAGQRQR